MLSNSRTWNSSNSSSGSTVEVIVAVVIVLVVIVVQGDLLCVALLCFAVLHLCLLIVLFVWLFVGLFDSCVSSVGWCLVRVDSSE